MKWAVSRFPLIIVLAGLWVAGCSTAHKSRPVYVAPRGAVVTSPTPAPKENIVGAPPGSKLEWSDGYWAFVDWHWVWVPGHWEEQRPGTGPWVWIPGQWDHHEGTWRWHPGRWEQEQAVD